LGHLTVARRNPIVRRFHRRVEGDIRHADRSNSMAA